MIKLAPMADISAGGFRCGREMPLEGAERALKVVAPAEYEAVRQWVLDGAPDN
jgi:hypothetical protein